MDTRTAASPVRPERSGEEPVPRDAGWRAARGEPSLANVFGSVKVARDGSFWRKLLGFLGPGYLVAVGYMDPGNWATSLAGGSRYGYALLSVVLSPT
jgi:manganese transport protein